MTHRLYASTSKVIAADPDLTRKIRTHVPDIDVFSVIQTDPGIVLQDEEEVTLPMVAPSCGATILAGDECSANLSAVSLLWTRAGLSTPPVVPSEAAVEGSGILAQLVAELEAELVRTAQSAIDLDRQIACLREEVEEGRATIADLRGQLKVLGQYPAECFDRRTNGAFARLTAENDIRQPLPFTGHRISAIGITLDPTCVRDLDASPVEARLIAREDDAILSRWLVRATDVTDRGEVLLALARQIPRRYRFLDLVLSVDASAAGGVGLHLAPDGGDNRLAVRDGDIAQQGQMLALRLWTGPVFDTGSRNDGALFELSQEEIATQKLRVPVPQSQLAAARKLTDPAEELNWFRISGRDVFCHPPKTGPSVLAIPLDLAAPVEGVCTRLELANDKAFPTEFGLLCSPLDLDADEVVKLLGNVLPDQRNVLAAEPWVTLRAGTARSVDLRFPQPVDRVVLYLATRAVQGRNDYAHAWFREVMGLRAGALRAAA